ncbi:MAG: NFACT family protein [Clostridia bacterium]|nr:NFACT family protein [Clostridia bacterium]
MAFDAGMLACTLAEIKRIALGARIEKVYQPERDEIILQMRSFEGGRRLCINAGSNNPRIGFTSAQREIRRIRQCFVCFCESICRGQSLQRSLRQTLTA